ncbi:MAG: von Willebrand factor type A domain-containing protein [Planctomycetota bacterium]|nr:von Willebrand factor type A domain-containing protein [Planctomycetota bacterium]
MPWIISNGRSSEAIVDEFPTLRPPDESSDLPYENPFYEALTKPFSTFSVDVDTASYSLVRRALNEGDRPDPMHVRIEEMLNYFDYNHPAPTGDEPVALSCTVGPCPWNSSNHLAMIGVRAKQVQFDDVPPSNLVFLIDVSGSMSSPDKLPLLKKCYAYLSRTYVLRIEFPSSLMPR